jgi:hypothetical protein
LALVKKTQRSLFNEDTSYSSPRSLAASIDVTAHPKECEAQVFSMYSWNEFSEGSGLCPTMGKSPEYKPDTRWLDEVARALAEWEYPTKN